MGHSIGTRNNRYNTKYQISIVKHKEKNMIWGVFSTQRITSVIQVEDIIYKDFKNSCYYILKERCQKIGTFNKTMHPKLYNRKLSVNEIQVSNCSS